MTTIERNLARIANFFDEVWNWGNLEAVEGMAHEDFVHHDPANMGQGKGHESLRQLVITYRTAFPDLRIDIEDVIAAGDQVAVRWVAHGSHRGALATIAATNRRCRVEGITIFRLKDEKLSEAWSEYDMLGLLQQLGVRTGGAGVDSNAL